MPLSKRFFLGDEELGKKDDDHNRGNVQLNLPAHLSWRLLRRRRILLALIGFALVYFMFFKHAPPEQVEPDEVSPPVPAITQPLPALNSRPNGAPPVPDERTPDADHYYDGRVKFYSLARSLYAVDGVKGYRREQKIVLFAVADLKSLSDLLPVACEMASKKFNRVHFAMMGRDEIAIEKVQENHNINRTECPMVWHDARPDYGPWSTDERMEASVRSALGHIFNIMRPPVIITRGTEEEESFFMRGVRRRAAQTGTTHISLPTRASNYKWITDLDSRALSVWNHVNIEILVHASPGSSGSLIRLLKSLHGADYFGPAPGLTIDLPVDTDPSLLLFLRDFNWPPDRQSREFTLRRRIHPQSITPQEATVRTLDAFYPKDPDFSHVLVLSPQAELAPSFYHFLKYSLLKYKYSTSTSRTYRLLGISLELPSFRPTDGEPFSAPEKSPTPKTQTDEIPEFLWQVPNSNAALYFGDKWMEFQSFIFNRFAPSLSAKQKSSPKLLLKMFPAWMEYMLEFIRVRGYFLLYPGQDKFALSTVHNELYRAPEEASSESNSSLDDHQQQKIQPKFAEKVLPESLTISDLLEDFPSYLPDLFSLEDLPYTGEDAKDGLIDRTEAFLQAFRKDVGGCGQDEHPPEVMPLKADDLFCLSEDEAGGFPGLGDITG